MRSRESHIHSRQIRLPHELHHPLRVRKQGNIRNGRHLPQERVIKVKNRSDVFGILYDGGERVSCDRNETTRRVGIKNILREERLGHPVSADINADGFVARNDGSDECLRSTLH